MTCYLCSNLNENQRNKFKCTDLAYISKGYLNWKKAISRFSDHSKSALWNAMVRKYATLKL